MSPAISKATKCSYRQQPLSILASQAPIDSVVSVHEVGGKVSAVSVCSITIAKAFLSQQGEHGVVRAGLGAWGQQPEVANIVPVTVGHMIGQAG